MGQLTPGAQAAGAVVEVTGGLCLQIVTFGVVVIAFLWWLRPSIHISISSTPRAPSTPVTSEVGVQTVASSSHLVLPPRVYIYPHGRRYHCTDQCPLVTRAIYEPDVRTACNGCMHLGAE
eukprot:2912497-Amphidinium_carterae.1